jgi:hypothetical protein
MREQSETFVQEGDLRAEQNELVLILDILPGHRWATDEQEAVSQKLAASKN